MMSLIIKSRLPIKQVVIVGYVYISRTFSRIWKKKLFKL